MKKTAKISGVCSRSVSFEINEHGIVSDISFAGGCNGNLKGISTLCEGMEATEIIKKLQGIHCGFKSTSCPDQFSKALLHELETRKDIKNENAI